MLLVIDVGNTNTVFGLFSDGDGDGDAPALVTHWRVETRHARPGDEYAALLHSFAAADATLAGRRPLAELVHDVIIVSVVPQTRFPLEQLCTRWLGRAPLEVVTGGARALGISAPAAAQGIDPGMPILLDDPRSVGADRVVDAVAAHAEDRARRGLVIVDMGTATTFNVVSPAGEYLGGAIAPGIHLAADALTAHAAKLPKVQIAPPPDAVGKNTVHAMQSGLFWGYVGLVDGVVARILASLSFQPRVLATGGLAPLVARESKTIEAVDQMLTLRGLELVYRRHKQGG